LAMWLILVIAVGLTEAGKLDGIAIAVLAVMAIACFEAITPLPQAFQFFGQTAAAARRLIHLTDQTAAVEGEAAGEDEQKEAELERGGAGPERVGSELVCGADRERAGSRLMRGPGDPDQRLCLEVKDVSFRYHANERYALQGLSLS